MSAASTSRGSQMSEPRGRRQRERGQIMILFVLVLIVIMGFAAMVIDVGVLRNANQNLWNALDAGALAGAQELPADPSNGADHRPCLCRPELSRAACRQASPSGFRCIIGSVGGAPRLSDIPAVCDPGGNAVLDLQRQDLQLGLHPGRGRHL